MKNYIGAQRVDDAKVYVGNVATVLMYYPESIAKRLADPFTGIASECKWYPNLAELKAFCEKRMEPFREDAERRRRHEDTRLLLTPPTASPEERQKAVERWTRDMRPTFAVEPENPRKRQLTKDEADAKVKEWAANPPTLPPLGDYAKATKAERAKRILGENSPSPSLG